jgi:hypothetical protein
MNNEEIKIEEKSTETIETTIDNKTSESGAVLPQVEPTKHKGGRPVTYTDEFILDEVTGLLSALTDNSEIIFLGELITDKPYSMQRISEWDKKGGEISETIEKIKDILQTRAVVGGLKEQLSSNMTKFHLINNFNWKDKNETDITTGGEKLKGMFEVNVISGRKTDGDRKD